VRVRPSNPLTSCRDSERVPYGGSDAHSRASDRSGSRSFPPNRGLAHNVVICAATSCCAEATSYVSPLIDSQRAIVLTFASLRLVVSTLRHGNVGYRAVAPPFSHRAPLLFLPRSVDLFTFPGIFFGVARVVFDPPVPSSRWGNLTVVRFSIPSRDPRGRLGAPGRTSIACHPRQQTRTHR